MNRSNLSKQVHLSEHQGSAVQNFTASCTFIRFIASPVASYVFAYIDIYIVIKNNWTNY